MPSLRKTVKRVLRVDRMQQAISERVLQQVRSECGEMAENLKREIQADYQVLAGEVMRNVRTEYTVMPRFQFHQPLDYDQNTFPIAFEPPVSVAGVELPAPAPDDRMGYSPHDVNDYLSWGKYDHDYIMGHIGKHASQRDNCTVFDFGCSSGRVLRHFDEEHRQRGWKLVGMDIQARPIEWMRRYLPLHFQVSVCSTMPHLPLPDASVDFIYGISVFTHIKYLWDAWLLELKRILKPGGLLMQTIHAEPAWEFYHKNRSEKWIKDAHSAKMLEQPKMEMDFLYYGDASCSQVFWKEEVARAYWGRYFTVLEVAPPPERSFQNWMICKKDA